MYKLILIAPAIMALTIASACAAKPNVPHKNVQKSAMASQNYIKPGAGIGYAHNLKSQYNVGETTTFKLYLGESYDSGVMRVTVTATGVQLLAADPKDFDMSIGGDHEMTVSFTANFNGRHYINVQALADIGDGNSMSRVFSIPVQVGPVTTQKPNPDMKTMADGENIIEMTAEEEIK